MPRPMKPSGVDWLGEIPADWTICRLKYCLSTDLQYGANSSGVPFEENLPRYIRITDISSARSLSEDNKLSLGLDEASTYLLDDNDILFARSGATVGKAFIYSSNIGQAAFAGYLIRAKTNPLKLLPKFLLLFTQSNAYDEWRNQIFIQSTIQNISAERYNNLPIILPSLDEQRRIANFLDKECARIDNVIEKTRASVEEYKKLKQSIITRAVTKGIRPNRTLKDSGIEWIGQIPDDWEIHQIKNDFQIFSGATPKSEVVENWDGDIVWITPADYKTNDRYIYQGKRNLSEIGYKSCGTTLVPSGSIIFSKRAPIGTVAIAAVELCTNQGCLSCVPKANTDSGYFCYVMSAFTEQFNLFGTGTTFKEISYNDFRSFKVPVPPLDEQKEIAEYLDEKTVAIDSLIAKKNRLVTELESLKKSLIFEYVTGKKEVPT